MLKIQKYSRHNQNEIGLHNMIIDYTMSKFELFHFKIHEMKEYAKGIIVKI